MGEGQTRVGPYELVVSLGRGGMAVVYAARLRGTGGRPTVALKLMHPQLVDDEAARRSFLDEAQLSAAIESPHVVRVFDVGETLHGALYLVMELVMGTTLHRMSRTWGTRLPLPVALEILAQAAEGLHAAHEARDVEGRPLHIVHRDVSPQNVLVGWDGIARVSDLGIAHAARRWSRTKTGQLKGKSAYLSPEQIDGGHVDRRADLFALGIVAWELLVGRRLFKRSSLVATLSGLLEGEVPALEFERADIPTEVCILVDAMLSRSPDGRPDTARQVAGLFRGAARRLGGTSEPRIGEWAWEAAPGAHRRLAAIL